MPHQKLNRHPHARGDLLKRIPNLIDKPNEQISDRSLR